MNPAAVPSELYMLVIYILNFINDQRCVCRVIFLFVAFCVGIVSS